MEKAFWEQRWREGRIGFHKSEVHPDLRLHEGLFLGDGPWRVLVPLCGKSLDMGWLYDRGHDVTGIDIVQEAIDAFAAEHGITGEHGPLSGGVAVAKPRLTLLCEDFFAVDPDVVGTFDRIWDRAALIAIDPGRRAEYAAHEARLLGPHGKILLSAFEYDQSMGEGPPWSVPEAEIPALFPGLTVERLDRRYIGREDRFRGTDLWEHVWLISRPGTVKTGG